MTIDTEHNLYKVYLDWQERWNISACCLWKLKTAGGFIWKFLID